MKRFGLIGYPLTHSFSQKYFTEKFSREGIRDCVYDLFPLDSIDQLPAVLTRHPDLCGLNVTIPYKQSVIPYLDDSALPVGVDACNCIRVEQGRLTGFNTDITGFEKSFSPLLASGHARALVLGNGGASAAVVHVLEKLGIPFHIVSRQLHGRSTLTYEQLNKEIMHDHRVIINTTPVGTFPDTGASPGIPYQFITRDHYLFDLVYNPAKTLFLQEGEKKGSIIKNGMDMLQIQAEENWRIWNPTST